MSEPNDRPSPLTSVVLTLIGVVSFGVLLVGTALHQRSAVGAAASVVWCVAVTLAIWALAAGGRRSSVRLVDAIERDAAATASRFLADRDRWNREHERLRAEHDRRVAEAVASAAVESDAPVADPDELVDRLRDLDADVTADVGSDGSVTLVVRRKKQRG